MMSYMASSRGGGTGTSIMEAKLVQQLAGIVQEPFSRSSLTLGRTIIHYTEGDAWKLYAGMSWDTNYSN